MTQIKIIQVKATSPQERVVLIEKVQNLNQNIMCKGSIYFEYNNELYADIYFVKGETEIKKLDSRHNVQEGVSHSDTLGKSANRPADKPFKPTAKTLQKWSKENIKEGTKKFLMKTHDMKEPELNNMTQLEAYQLSESLKKKNI